VNSEKHRTPVVVPCPISDRFSRHWFLFHELAGPEYGLNFSYDGWGNLTSQQVFKGSGYNTSLSYNGQTNRITSAGYAYDASGNLTAMPYLSLTYNAQSQLAEATHSVNGTEQYAYDPRGQRILRYDTAFPTPYFWFISFYGPDGKLLADCYADYEPPNPQYPQYTVFATQVVTEYVYFGSRLVRTQSAPRMLDEWGLVIDTVSVKWPDRLGSIGRYYPYGEERQATANDTFKFATYIRSSKTGLDYANQRYYSTQIARFTSPDPYQASGGPGDPQSWNRYAYVQNDPVNANDPSGLQLQRYAYDPFDGYNDWIPQTPGGGGGLCVWRLYGGENRDRDGYWDCWGTLSGGPTPPPATVEADSSGRAPERVPAKHSDERDRNGIYCDPTIITAMLNAWMRSSNGTRGTEAGFTLQGSRYNYTITPKAFTNERGRITFIPPPNTWADFHVHPQGYDPSPTRVDADASAVMDGSVVYTFGIGGLWMYNPSDDKSYQLTKGLEWQKPCKEDHRED
jgi:RHS repeat-associated protein